MITRFLPDVYLHKIVDICSRQGDPGEFVQLHLQNESKRVNRRYYRHQCYRAAYACHKNQMHWIGMLGGAKLVLYEARAQAL